MAAEGGEVEGVDSRRWTGPEPAPVPLDRRAARAAFRAAGGPGTVAPQRAAALVSWLGLVLMLAVILVGADGRARLLGLEPLAARVRAGLEGWLTAFAGPKDAEGLLGLAGDPRPLAAVLAIAGTLAGLASAWRHRAALARGFAAAEAGTPGAVFTTLQHWGAAPLLFVLISTKPPDGPLFAANALALWLVARFAAAGLVAVAERRAAGLGARGAAPSRWDVATIVVSLGGMLLLLAHALHVVG